MLLTAAALLLAPTARAAPWPEASAWTPVQLDGAPLSDPCDDVAGSDWWDVVGTADAPAAYLARDGDTLWFRLRLRAAPYEDSGSSARWRSFSWGVLVEADWSKETVGYELAVYVDGASDEVVLAANTTREADFAADQAETELDTWAAPLAEAGTAGAGLAGWSSAGTDLCGGTGDSVDYFVDWGVPWADLAAAAGVSAVEELAFVLGTSASAGLLSKDVAGWGSAPGDAPYWDVLSDSDGLGDGGADDGGSADGGAGDGGAPDGGTADGGAPDGGTADGGTADGGTPDGGTADGGTADGGTADGGTADGGGDGGAPDGGTPDSGQPDTSAPAEEAVQGGTMIGGACLGCAAGPAPGAAWGLLVWVALRRRRRPAGAGFRVPGR